MISEKKVGFIFGMLICEGYSVDDVCKKLLKEHPEHKEFITYKYNKYTKE